MFVSYLFYISLELTMETQFVRNFFFFPCLEVSREKNKESVLKMILMHNAYDNGRAVGYTGRQIFFNRLLLYAGYITFLQSLKKSKK